MLNAYIIIKFIFIFKFIYFLKNIKIILVYMYLDLRHDLEYELFILNIFSILYETNKIKC